MRPDALTGLKTSLAHCVRGLLAARRRRIEREREFYLQLTAYCDDNNLSQVCTDDWQTTAYAGVVINRSPSHVKGNVS